MISIIGYGIVGQATHVGLLDNREVTIFDPANDNFSKTIVKNMDVIFICLPSNNLNDLNNILQTCQTLQSNNPDAEFVIRSTIPLSFIDTLSNNIHKWSYCPEFLRERHWKTDCKIEPIIIGSRQTSLLINLLADKKLNIMTVQEAATLKLALNCFNSLRVVFANHIYNICQTNNTNYDIVKKELESKIDSSQQSYLEVNPSLRGFGGKCLPKDLDLLISDFRHFNLTQSLFDAIQQDNQLWPITIRED